MAAANNRLRELDRMKDDFISTVTHELRTADPIRALSELLSTIPGWTFPTVGAFRHHRRRGRAG